MGTSSAKKPSSSKKRGWKSFHTVIGIWGGIAFWHWKNKPEIVIAFPLALAANVLEMLWNVFFAFLLTHAVVRVWLVPIWRRIFQETGKLGQKLEWYDASFKQMGTKNKVLLRISCVFIISFSLFVLSKVDLPWVIFFPNFSKIWLNSNASIIIYKYFSRPVWIFASNFGVFSFILWIFLILEGRSRLIYRALQFYQTYMLSRKYLKPLAKIPYSTKSDSLDIALFTSFKNEEHNYSLKQSDEENWFVFNEKGQKGNVMVIGPTGGGKTMAVVLPLLNQCIAWHAQDPEKKAALVVYDPKAELTSIVAKAAMTMGRNEDLIIFSLDGKTRVNPIKINNPWDGESAWKVAGWIVGAWQNYQGKSSPEPYWESQNFILTRNLLVMEYFQKDIDVTMRDIAEAINEASAGCFRLSSQGKYITQLGKKVLIALAAVDRERYIKNYAKLEFDDIDHTLITLEIRTLTAQRLALQTGKYSKERENYHLENDHEIQSIYELNGNSLLDIKSKKAVAERVSELVKKDLKEKFGDSLPTDHDHMHTTLLLQADRLNEIFKLKHADAKRREQYLSIVEQAGKWLLESWSSNASDNRGSIVSNMQPFIQQFQTPELAYIFSPSAADETLSFDSTITLGKILVPDFPGIKIGNGLAQGIITLIKSRWQHSVLALGKETERLKIQIMDEAQKIMCLGDGQKAIGEFDYCELSRSFGGITWFLSQSIASLEAKASREIDWKKVHGVVRSIICMSTNDTSTIKFMQEIAGKEVKKRISRTVTETANAPGLDMISEKYSGDSDSLGISYTISEALEERLQTSDIQDADAYSAIASIFDGRKNNLCRVALRPTFWPDPRDRYELIQRAEFDPAKRLAMKKINAKRKKEKKNEFF